MYNWSVDIKQLNKHPAAARLWKLEQTINFGLNGRKINKTQLKRNWARLHLDPARKKFLQSLLWPKKF